MPSCLPSASSTRSRRSPAALAAALSLVGLAASLLLGPPIPALADPFDQVVVDGTITPDTLDWYPADLVAPDAADDDLVTRTGNIRNLWLTWDADSLYLGIDYQDIGGTLGLQVYLDLQRGLGTGDLGLGLRMPPGDLAELALVHPEEGNTDPAVLPGLGLLDEQGGVQPLEGYDIAQGSTYWLPSKSRFGLMCEVGIPWSIIYPDLETTVPPLAAIKAVAVIRSTDPALDAMDVAPSSDLAPPGSAERVLHELAVSVVDRDGDGEPDPSDAALGGTVTLPADLAGVAVTAEAELIDWTGRTLGAPLSRFTGRAGEDTFLLPRLPAGRYRVTVRARGALPATAEATVAEGEHRLDLAFALERATGISGTVGFLSGGGAAGALRLLDDQGTELDRLAFPAAGGPFEFYVADSGTYTIEASAENYVTSSTEVTVTAGTDVTGLQILLEKKTEVSGRVGFLSLPGAPGNIVLSDEAGTAIGSQRFIAAGSAFRFFLEQGGVYRLRATAPTFYTLDTLVTVTWGEDVTGLELLLERLPRARGAVSLEGPDSPGLVTVGPQGAAATDTVAFTAAGDTFSFYLAPGAYTLRGSAAGYVPGELPVTVGTEPVQDLGSLRLEAVRATRLVLVDAAGEQVPYVATTVSYPADGVYTFGRVRVAAIDDAARRDLFDVDGRLGGFRLSARKLDDVSPPRGNVLFLSDPALEDTTSRLDLAGGEATFWMVDDAVEILHVGLRNDVPDGPTGRLMVSFRDPRPEAILLTVDRDTLVADGADELVISAQLYDSADNLSRLPGVPIGFSVLPSSGGRGSFEVGTVGTNADGFAQAVLSATGAGRLLVTAAATVDNIPLHAEARVLNGPDSTLVLTVLPGPTAGWALEVPSRIGSLSDPLPVTGRLVDAFGNTTPVAGRDLSLAAEPPDRGSFEPAAAISDTAGLVRASFLPAGVPGAVHLGGRAGGLAVEGVDVQLRDVLIETDPPWYAEPRTRQTFAATDLTAAIVDNDPENLLVTVPFASNWAGLQLTIALETGFDAAGGAQDAFEQPVYFGQADRPDYILTTKYSANDYGDFRRWNGTAWEWWIPETGTWDPANGASIQAWVTKGTEAVDFRIPLEVMADPDSLRLEVYLTQQEGDAAPKRSAFDSVPSDSTLNLDFPPDSTDPADWASTEQDVTLHAWSRVYRVDRDFPAAPGIAEVAAVPAELSAGALFTLSARVTDGGDGVGDVLGDLSAMGGSTLARMFDDGVPEHGDAAAGDGVYSLRASVPLRSPGGELTLRVRAYDAGNESVATGETVVEVAAAVEAILHAEDAIGDDHGPDQFGVEGKYYTYPTNSVFVPGAFDIESLDVFETVAVVGGEPVDMLAFQVKVGDFPDPADEGTADWNPLYADINIQKLDILIDSAPGGATATLPSRQAAMQRWDAWEYAIIVDGWYKAVVPSLGQNTVEAWRESALRTDRDIVLTADPVLDTITALVSREALGNPTPDDIRRWDLTVMMLGHDGDADFGGVRWVGDTRWEWGFGGGDYTDRDSNVIDLLLVPGTGKSPGRPQSELLDYESEEALQRLADGLTPVAVEATAFEDTGPPVIRIERNAGELVRRDPLLGAPLSPALRITDDWRVESAVFRYRPAGQAGGGWSEEEPMGYLGGDMWGVDILPSWLERNLTYSPVDSSRYLEFEVESADPLGKTSRSSVVTMQITPTATCIGQTATGGVTLRQVDGSYLDLGQVLPARLIASHAEEAWPGGPITADSLATRLSIDWDVCVTPPAARSAPAVPSGRSLGVFRALQLQTRDDLGGVLPVAGRQPATFEVGLHYPQAWVPTDADEQRIGLYEYHPAADRWVLVGGHVNPTGNLVTARVDHTGIYGLFAADGLGYDEGEVVSGIAISPNPFSPNGDGLYDETTISFYLSREATVTAEIYNIDGKRERIITQNYPFSAEEQSGSTQPRRVPGLIWDGRNFNDDDLPYGIYVIRLLVTYNQAGGSRTIRSNHAVVLIR